MAQPATNNAAKYTCQFFVGGAYLGQGQRSFEFVHNQVIPPHSLAFFCQACGDIWARVLVQDGSEFQVYSRRCQKHSKYFFDPGGSIWFTWDRDWQEALPKAILQREVVLLCDHWVKHNKETVDG
jgi:hypothetical protein